jgi:hypothetical protein
MYSFFSFDPTAAVVKRNLAIAKNCMSSGGDGSVRGMPLPSHMSSEIEAQLRNHIHGNGPLPADVFELPPHLVRQMQSEISPGMSSQCAQQ